MATLAKDLKDGDKIAVGGTVLKLENVTVSETEVWFEFVQNACDGNRYRSRCKMRPDETTYRLQ